MSKFLFLVFFGAVHLSLFGLDQRDTPKHYATSIIVPCYYKHFKLIPELLTCYENQTVLPDEVIICLTINRLGDITPKMINAVLKTPRPFTVKIVYDDGEYPGKARNWACECSNGDLLICQDADDIPHPQRTEIIKHLFENYHVDFLIHRWMDPGNEFTPYDENEVVSSATYFDEYSNINYDYIHNGNVALTKEVFSAIKWPGHYNGEDVEFNKQVFQNFEYKVGVDQYLIIYRNELSSYRDRD